MAGLDLRSVRAVSRLIMRDWGIVGSVVFSPPAHQSFTGTSVSSHPKRKVI